MEPLVGLVIVTVPANAAVAKGRMQKKAQCFLKVRLSPLRRAGSCNCTGVEYLVLSQVEEETDFIEVHAHSKHA
jgi:hypothetical protein